MTDDLSAQRYNSRLGLSLFVLYLAFYVGFVLINAFRPQWMDIEIIAGLNLAVVYGFALIGVAIVLAVIYGVCCKLGREPQVDAGPNQPGLDRENGQ